MKKTSTIIAILALIYNLTAIEGGNDIVIVKPVLAPTSRFGAKVPETAKDFPLLMILAHSSNDIAPEVPKDEGDHLPIYVKVSTLSLSVEHEKLCSIKDEIILLLLHLSHATTSIIVFISET